MPKTNPRIYAAVITDHEPDTQKLGLPGYNDPRERPALGIMHSQVLRLLKERLEKPEALLAIYLFEVKRGWEKNLGGLLFTRCRKDIVLPQAGRGIAKRLENPKAKDDIQNSISIQLHNYARKLHDALDEPGMKMIIVDGEKPLPPLMHIVSMRDRVVNRETGQVYVNPGPLKQLAA